VVVRRRGGAAQLDSNPNSQPNPKPHPSPNPNPNPIPNRRYDVDGELYTRDEFIAEYGGTQEWEQAGAP